MVAEIRGALELPEPEKTKNETFIYVKQYYGKELSIFKEIKRIVTEEAEEVLSNVMAEEWPYGMAHLK